MQPVTLEFLTEQIELADQLLAGRDKMFEPQDLPGRFGRVVRAIDHVLKVTNCPALLGGDCAVWHHGFVGRIILEIDIAIPAGKIDEFRLAASVSGFEMRVWPKMVHKETGVQVDILPERTQPGVKSMLAPTAKAPGQRGAEERRLRYMTLPSLIELKIASGWIRDESDVIELVRVNFEKVEIIRQHLSQVNKDCVQVFDRLVTHAREQQDR